MAKGEEGKKEVVGRGGDERPGLGVKCIDETGVDHLELNPASAGFCFNVFDCRHHPVGVGDADGGEDEDAVDDGLPHHAGFGICASPGRPIVPMSMNVFNRWIELMPMIAMASFTLNTLALTWLSHSGWSGWP